MTRCPAARLKVFRGSGHFPHHDDPAGFAAALTDFIATTKASKPDA
ncbi:MAG: alpha/beta hydrolase [Chloroflexi bacterium]|nr:alpha/beta hydrolase [Chloroflexota bacterium]